VVFLKGMKNVRTYPDIPVPIILGVGVVADGFHGRCGCNGAVDSFWMVLTIHG
jgi:hypothetical protein